MEYISKNQGLLSAEMVKTGDKLVVLEVTTYFSEKQQIDKWNIKVELPNKLHKLYSPMDTILDAMADKWGKETNEWTGHTIEVELRTSKKTGNLYIWTKTTDLPKVDLEAIRVANYKEEVKKAQESGVESAGGKSVPYPQDTISPDDIPF